jgi:hypothetical protein
MRADQLIKRIEIRDRNGKVVGTKDVVTYPGLLSKAHEDGLVRVTTRLVQAPTEENGRTAIAKAVVVTKKGHFEGVGDASPENVNSFIVPHLIRVAETRAKARALRDAVNVGVVSFEELNGDGIPDEPTVPTGEPEASGTSRRKRPSPVPQAVTPGSSATVPMTDSQRRYLFRLMASRGFVAQAAEVKLKEMLEVESLKDVTKIRATELIDELLREGEREAGHG